MNDNEFSGKKTDTSHYGEMSERDLWKRMIRNVCLMITQARNMCLLTQSILPKSQVRTNNNALFKNDILLFPVCPFQSQLEDDHHDQNQNAFIEYVYEHIQKQTQNASSLRWIVFTHETKLFASQTMVCFSLHKIGIEEMRIIQQFVKKYIVCWNKNCDNQRETIEKINVLLVHKPKFATPATRQIISTINGVRYATTTHPTMMGDGEIAQTLQNDIPIKLENDVDEDDIGNSTEQAIPNPFRIQKLDRVQKRVTLAQTNPVSVHYELWDNSSFCIHTKDHILHAKTHLLNESEEKLFFEAHPTIKKKDLPYILTTDMCVRYHGWQSHEGQIIHTVQFHPTTVGSIDVYRVITQPDPFVAAAVEARNLQSSNVSVPSAMAGLTGKFTVPQRGPGGGSGSGSRGGGGEGGSTMDDSANMGMNDD